MKTKDLTPRDIVKKIANPNQNAGSKKKYLGISALVEDSEEISTDTSL